METSNLRKAAVVLLSLPRRRADELLGRLDPAQAAAVGGEMDRLGKPDQDEQAAAVREFTAAATDTASSQPFQFLRGTTPKDLAALLADERPQTIALLLSYLPAVQAAAALGALPPERQTSVLRCVAAIDRPGPEIVRDVEEAVQLRLAGKSGFRTGAGVANVVKILNAMRPAGERRLLDELAWMEPGLHGEIRRTMFGPDVAAFPRSDAADAA